MTHPDRLAAELLHHRADDLQRGDPLPPPLVGASVFHLPGSPEADYVYGRYSTPTWQALEAQLALLEQAPCVAFPSGMAAITGVLYSMLSAGDRIVVPSDGYFTTRVFSTEFLAPMNIEVVEHPTADFANAPIDDAALVFVETPSNPGLDVCDLQLVCEKAKAAGARVVADNTTLTPLLQRPLDLGADVVVASDTKAPAGHSDLLLGHVASRDATLLEKIERWRSLSGCIPGPFEAWLAHRGIETLEVRLSRMCETALVIATRLAEHPSVQAVRYPGLPSDPSFEISRRQTHGFGFLIGVTLQDAAAADRMLGACPFVAETTSFGGVHSSGERRARWGDQVAEGFVRLSVGCEPVEPLWSAIDDALRA